MRAICWQHKNKVSCENVEDPIIQQPGDIIIEVTLSAICGSDLHLYDGNVPTMKKGDVMGHEFMGRVVEVGGSVRNLQIGDRVVIPFAIACGACFFCKRNLWSLCDNSNPNAEMAEKIYGSSAAGLFGYSHLFGGYPGGQAEYVRVPFADVGALKIPDELPDEKVLFLSDIFPTGYMAAEACEIHPGDTVAVWGCGPVGLFAIASAYMLGAERVIAIDRFPERLALAESLKAEVINYEETKDLIELLKQKTKDRGPDACIDAVGMEAHGTSLDAIWDRLKMNVHLATDRAVVLRQIIQACRKGGMLSIPGVYAGFPDKINFGAAFSKGLTFKMGQTHVHRYMRPLLERIQKQEIDPSFIITHQMSFDEIPDGYEIFKKKEDDCVKIVLNPKLAKRQTVQQERERAGVIQTY
jgi:threonine dehydrogenase-like Zn-dependent dehydrogenase